MKKLPIGIQSIKKILEKNNYLYVDKTKFIKLLLDEGAPHFFISRPRRFGKSLFLNTLEEVFLGNKELFKGLYIYNTDYLWEKHIVLYFDFGLIPCRNSVELEDGLKAEIQRMAEIHGCTVNGPSFQFQLRVLIEKLSKKAPVVILVDEYDSAIINNLKNLDIVDKNREILKSFFTSIKSLDRFLKFTFVTGVSKFSQVSLFSGPNNITDITMSTKYASIMGYDEEEITNYLHSYINNSKEKEIMSSMKEWYNGYRFSEKEVTVYNPFSTLNYVQNLKIKAYWYSSGTPSFLIEQVKKHPANMISLDNATATEESLMDISSLENIDITALMYQTGYLTIKNYNSISKIYHLGIPNQEVRTAFINSLVQNFSLPTKIKQDEIILKSLENFQLDILFKFIEVGFSSLPYQVFAGAKEITYQSIILSILYGMGFEALSERATNIGRIDVVLDIENTIYIIELKLNQSSEVALQQIEDKEYYKPYLLRKKNIVLIGANFASKTRNISDWKAKILSPEGKLIKILN